MRADLPSASAPSRRGRPLTARAREWAATMEGHRQVALGVRQAHDGPPLAFAAASVLDREAREAAEAAELARGATRADGAGDRARPEEPDPWRTCFERDRDRILHEATSFRRLAGKTQVFIFPADHQRTRLTHALEVSQVATTIARACRLNVALTEAIALGHDCGHGPFGHASEDAFDPYLPGGFRHAPFGARVTLAGLNLCRETLDGIANHSWSRPAPATPEGAVVRFADRIAYVCHDFEDAVRAGVVRPDALPAQVAATCGRRRSEQLRAFITDVVETSVATGAVAMSEEMGAALAAFRAFNYERIYLRPESAAQAEQVQRLLRALVEHFVEHPELLGAPAVGDVTAAAVAYVAGMTDRFACEQAKRLLDWPADDLPRGFDT